MADTDIEWADSVWNPVRGCRELSPGCARCYAKTFAERWRGVPGHPYEQGFDFRLVPEKLCEPLTWRKPRRVFVNSMSDLWLEEVPNDYIAAVFGMMAAAHQHTYMTLTKRADRLPVWFRWMEEIVARPSAAPHHTTAASSLLPYVAMHGGPVVHPAYRHVHEHGSWPLSNLWVGVSVENRKHGLPRIDLLRQARAAVRFLSIEPLLEDLGELDLTGIGWVIVGGESGNLARVCRLEWIESVVEQCRRACVPVFVKQLGARPAGEWRGKNQPRCHVADVTVQPTREYERLNRTKAGVWKLIDRKGGSVAEWPEHLRVREWPELRS